MRTTQKTRSKLASVVVGTIGKHFPRAQQGDGRRDGGCGRGRRLAEKVTPPPTGSIHAMGQRRRDRLAPHIRRADARVHRHPLPPRLPTSQPPRAPLDGDGQPGRHRPQLAHQARDARVR